MATINDIQLPGVDGTGVLQPKLRNRFRVTFANLGGGADSQPVTVQVINASRPKVSYEEIELNRYNTRIWIAGKYTFEPMTIVIEDDVKGTASQVLQLQSQAQQYLIGAEGQFLATAPEASLYKFVTYLDALDGNDQVIEKWIMEGCWLQNLDYMENDYAANEAQQITMTIRYDLARQINGGYNAGQGLATGGAGA